jgi:hypothetical protein
MSKYLKPIRFATFCALISLLIFSQTASARTCRILFLDRPNDAPKSLHLFDGTSSQEVVLPSMNLSPIYKLPEGALKLSLLTAKVEDTASVSPDAPSVEIPETYVDFYLVVSSDPDNKIAPVSIKAYYPADETLKPGQMFWINLTDKTIEGKIGEQTLSLLSESSKILNAPRSDIGDYPIALNYLIQGKDAAYPICETIWQHNPNSRSLVIISSSEGRKAPRVSAFTDSR